MELTGGPQDLHRDAIDRNGRRDKGRAPPSGSPVPEWDIPGPVKTGALSDPQCCTTLADRREGVSGREGAAAAENSRALVKTGALLTKGESVHKRQDRSALAAARCHNCFVRFVDKGSCQPGSGARACPMQDDTSLHRCDRQGSAVARDRRGPGAVEPRVDSHRPDRGLCGQNAVPPSVPAGPGTA